MVALNEHDASSTCGQCLKAFADRSKFFRKVTCPAKAEVENISKQGKALHIGRNAGVNDFQKNPAPVVAGMFQVDV